MADDFDDIFDRAPDRPGKIKINRRWLNARMLAVEDALNCPRNDDFIKDLEGELAIAGVSGLARKGIQRTILDHTSHWLWPPLEMFECRFWWAIPFAEHPALFYWRSFPRRTNDEIARACDYLEWNAHNTQRRADEAFWIAANFPADS